MHDLLQHLWHSFTPKSLQRVTLNFLHLAIGSGIIIVHSQFEIHSVWSNFNEKNVYIQYEFNQKRVLKKLKNSDYVLDSPTS
jgi:hypothetical protein